jgi:hypothetical protein
MHQTHYMPIIPKNTSQYVTSYTQRSIHAFGTPKCTCARTHTHTLTHIHTLTQMRLLRTHTHSLTHTHTHTHTHAPPPPLFTHTDAHCGAHTLSPSRPDPSVLHAVRFLQGPIASLISTLRAPKSAEGYAKIGGGSPLRQITEDQARALAQALARRGVDAKVYVGMRYWKPFMEDAMEKVGHCWRMSRVLDS